MNKQNFNIVPLGIFSYIFTNYKSYDKNIIGTVMICLQTDYLNGQFYNIFTDHNVL